MMNRLGLKEKATTGVTSSTGSTDEEEWTTDESSGASRFNTKSDIAPQPLNHGRKQIKNRKSRTGPSSPERDKKKSRRKSFQSLLPLVPYIDDEGTQEQQDRISAAQNKFADQRPSHHHHRRRRVPLMELIQNEWHTRSKSGSRGDDGLPDLVQVLSAPKVRRWSLAGFALFCLLWAYWRLWARGQWHDHTLLRNAVDGKLKSGLGAFGTNMRADFAGGVVHLRNLDDEIGTGWREKRSRLVIIGDVHGCFDELVNLLAEVSHDAENDHVICVGDMISKGPSSSAVIDLLVSLKASCVRGNHEDRVLLTYQHLKSHGLIPPGPSITKSSQQPSTLSPTSPLPSQRTNKLADSTAETHDLATSLSDSQIEYLSACPLILNLGSLPSLGGEASTFVVHAGLVPGIALENQDPFSVMNMRTLDPETWVPSRSATKGDDRPWNEIYTKFQTYLPPHRRSTVIYGHDSRRGLQLTPYTKGLDTGCVKGGRLTALVIALDDQGQGAEAEPRVVSVECRDYRRGKERREGEGA